MLKPIETHGQRHLRKCSENPGMTAKCKSEIEKYDRKNLKYNHRQTTCKNTNKLK